MCTLFHYCYTAFLTELIHGVVGKVYNFQPLLTRTEVTFTSNFIALDFTTFKGVMAIF